MGLLTAKKTPVASAYTPTRKERRTIMIGDVLEKFTNNTWSKMCSIGNQVDIDQAKRLCITKTTLDDTRAAWDHRVIRTIGTKRYTVAGWGIGNCM